jgi:spermidine/putrescine transport system ATP-binding protein
VIGLETNPMDPIPTEKALERTRDDPRRLAVELRGISKRYSTQVAVHPLDLAIGEGEFVTLLGPSGCGKTTVLRIVAGLEVPDGGSVRIFGEDVTDRPANKRPVNLVFQRATLFPHLSVAENIAFGPKLRRADKSTTKARVESLLELVQLPGYGSRRINELSGGQAQRVALVRALANDPKVLLLDEPLSALDLAIRRQLQSELKDIHRRLGLTFLYVTHDQDEALSMSDRVVVMRDGRIQQMGTPVEIYRNPCSPFVARFLGLSNVVAGVVSDVSSDGLVLDGTGLRVVAARPDFAASVGESLSIVIRPDVIEMRPIDHPDAAGNDVHGTVEDVRFAGSVIHYTVKGERHDWQVSVGAVKSQIVSPGTKVALRWRPEDCVVMPTAQ